VDFFGLLTIFLVNHNGVLGLFGTACIPIVDFLRGWGCDVVCKFFQELFVVILRRRLFLFEFRKLIVGPQGVDLVFFGLLEVVAVCGF
jgi:hypothetical protein